MPSKKHIKINLDFLDKNDSKAKPQPASNKPENEPGPKNPNWVYYDGKQSPPPKNFKKGWFWVFGIVGGLILIGILSGDSSNTSSYSYSPNGGEVQVGHYMCSSYYASQADSLAPNSYVASSLSSDSNQLDATSASLDRERSQIENEYVDEYSQYSIDQHNARIDAYNAKLQRYRNDLSTYNASLDAYNTKVDIYNNYLQAHCTSN